MEGARGATFDAELRRFREAASLTQEELAASAHLGEQAWKEAQDEGRAMDFEQAVERRDPTSATPGS